MKIDPKDEKSIQELAEILHDINGDDFETQARKIMKLFVKLRRKSLVGKTVLDNRMISGNLYPKNGW